ncbi:hypothetical protein [Verrucomicrobium sp. 3C]|uniref:hypothetical protein n=1 Tax=Verrucomicrobium sp. 3C TaxID=1134055 RepID=UPI000368F296|nr:hypothetical protein [Verrucomicrobium sp. 3C]
MNKQQLLFQGLALAMGLGGLFLLTTSWAGGEFEPPVPKFPYGPTDPKGNLYSVAATDLVYSPTSPYVRVSSEVAKLEKSKRTKRTTRRAVRRRAAPTDLKGTP